MNNACFSTTVVSSSVGGQGGGGGGWTATVELFQWMEGAALVGTEETGLVGMGQWMEGAVLVGTAGQVCMGQELGWYTRSSDA